ncbi:hypothetical protein MMC11_001405 [Xylographa trunciseda]|nr:hypothetical protein [Xylographa trunciseda]
MDDFEVPPAKKLRLDLQPGRGAALLAGPVDSMDDLHGSPPAIKEDSSPLEKKSEEMLASLRTDAFEPIFELQGLEQSHSIHGTGIKTGVLPGELQASTSGYLAQDISVLLPETINGNAPRTSEILGIQSHITNLDMINAVVGTDTLKFRVGKVESGRGSGLLTEEVNPNTNSILDGVDGVEQTEEGPRLTRPSSPLRKTSRPSAPSVIRPLSFDPNSDGADSPEPLQENMRQPLSSHKPSDGMAAGDTNFKDNAKAKEHVLLQEDKVNIGPQVAPSVLAGDGLADREEDRVANHNLPFSLESSQSTSATSMPDEVHGISTTSLDVDLGVPDTVEAEFELDSSPIVSSTDSLSVGSSDDSNDDDYEMLDPSEQARRLMQEDGGSEDEGEKKGATNGPLRTLNEKPDDIVETPNVIVTADMNIEELGNVETLVGNLVLIKAKTTGEFQVLETGSVLCLQDRTIIGVVAETLGRVQQPLYSVRFTNAQAIKQAGIWKGTYIYYVPQYSTYVFTQTLKAIKGSDASNIHDEEVGDDELEFSDDEAEADYKRSLKLQKQARRAGRGSASNGFSRKPRPNEVEYSPRKNGWIRKSEDVSINYDEISVDDDLYTPLARPLNLHEQMGQEEPSSNSKGENRKNDNRFGRSRGDSNRSRGGRGRGSRGRGREQYRTEAPNVSTGRPQPAGPQLDLSLPPMPPAIRPSHAMAPPQHPLPSPSPHSTESPYSPTHPHQYHGYGSGISLGQQQGSSRNGQTSYNYPPQLPFPSYQPPYQHYPQHGQIPPQHSLSQSTNPYRQPSPLHTHGPVSLSYSTPPLPPGAFVNPAFFGNNYQHPVTRQSFTPNYKGYSPQHNSYSNDGQM